MLINVNIENKLSVKNVKIAKSLVERGIGLMFKKKMNGFNGLLIEPCKSIHTFFMRYPIDVLFLDKDWKIKKIIRRMKPWRMTTIYFSSARVLELKGGELSSFVSEGDVLTVECIN